MVIITIKYDHIFRLREKYLDKNEGVQTFHRGISPKLNILKWLVAKTVDKLRKLLVLSAVKYTDFISAEGLDPNERETRIWH